MSNTKENKNTMDTIKKPVRFKNHTIESTPTEKFQELVTVTKGAKKWDIIGRQYISEEKARLAIEKVYSDSLIESGEIKAKKVVINLGLGKEGDSVQKGGG